MRCRRGGRTPYGCAWQALPIRVMGRSLGGGRWLVAVLLWRGPAVERSSLPPAGVKRSIAVLALLLAFTLA